MTISISDTLCVGTKFKDSKEPCISDLETFMNYLALPGGNWRKSCSLQIWCLTCLFRKTKFIFSQVLPGSAKFSTHFSKPETTLMIYNSVLLCWRWNFSVRGRCRCINGICCQLVYWETSLHYITASSVTNGGWIMT